MRVLITGGAGYIGNVLVRTLLHHNHNVMVLDNLMYGQTGLTDVCSNPLFTFVYGDARDRRILEPLVSTADVIIPLAAIVGAPACDLDPELANSTNVGAVQTLNKLVSQSQLVLYPTTNSGYGTKSGVVYCTEQTPLEPITLYGRTKAEAEALLMASSKPGMTFRLATVFGVSARMRTDLIVNDFVYRAVREHHIVLFEKTFRRNFVHIQDVADCLAYMLRLGLPHQNACYNLGNDDLNMTKEELAFKIKDHFPNLLVLDSPNGKDPDKRNYIVSSEKLRKAGFTATRTLDTGIEELKSAYQMYRRMLPGNV